MEQKPQDDVSRHDTSQRDMPRHILTIKQAADLFSQHGVSRSPRSVQRFCELGHLDCARIKGDKGERYFVDPLSIERYAEELKQLENISNLGVDTMRHDALQRDVPRRDATFEIPSPIPKSMPERDDEIVVLRARVMTLKKANLQLSIDRSAKEQVIGQMAEERQVWLDQLIAQSREIGRLETQVQQLAAPQRDTSRHDATAVVLLDATAAEPEQTVIDSATQADPEPPTRSVWRRIFG